ncbi:MAG: Gfo/Idh/MocA family oxidoreductase [Candidatus Limnocylindrales bacterium]
MSEQGRLRVGLAGLGSMGRNHLRNLVARDDVVLAAIADPSDEVLLPAAEQTGARPYSNSLDMLDEERLDALVIAAPTTLHHEIALQAIDRGVPVLVEKPLATTVAEGRELVDAATRRGVLLQAGHIERFNPAVLALGERLRAGALSRIFSIKTLRAGPFPARIRDVGVAVDLATHDVDIMCHLAGARPDRVYAETTQHIHTTHEDLVFGLLHFAGGTVGLLDVNWLTPEKQRRITVLGEEGMFQVDYLSQTLTFTRGTAELSPTYLDGYAPTFAGETVSLPVVPAEPLRRELDAFFKSIRTGRPAAIPGSDGLWAVALANLLLESAAARRPVAVHPPEVVHA